jgi:tocopherol O-methyltransferase
MTSKPRKSVDHHAVLAHYDVDVGAGDAYKFLADWPHVLQALFFGWERALSHPAVLHYGFDHMPGESLEKSLYRLHENVTRDLGDIAGKVILDAGSGLGGVSLDLARRYPTTQFIGVNLSPGQVGVATRRARRARVRNVSYRVADYRDLPDRDETYDGIFAVETLCHVPNHDKQGLLEEFFRVLKPGGRLVVYDGYLNPDPASWKLQHLHTQVSSGWAVPNPITTAPFFISCAEKSGFRIVKNTRSTDRIISFSYGLKQWVR